MSQPGSKWWRDARGVLPRMRRDVAHVVLAVLLASTGVVGGMALVLQGASVDAPPAAAPSTDTSTTAPPVPDVAPAVAIDPAVGVRRHRVGAPKDYPGLLASAPLPAIAAYQRAATIIGSASDCGLGWVVLAAIGRVESNHGRSGAFGAPLDGGKGSDAVPDTDLGAVDHDRQWDAPVGPMRLLPTTWTAVAVDADNDGIRNPQDLDDAALAAAVLLCSHGDLTQPGALTAALTAYHRAPGFVRTVLVLTARYAEQATLLPPPPAVVSPLPALPASCACTTQRAARHLPSGGTTAGALTQPPRPPSPPGTPTPTPSDEPTDPGSPTDDPSPTDGGSPTEDPSPTDGGSPTDEPSPGDDPSPTDGESPTGGDSPTEDPTDSPSSDTTSTDPGN